MRFSCAALLAAVTAAGTGAARADCPERFEFVVIADDAGELALSDPQFIGNHAIPSLGPDGKVAFTSWLDAGGREILVGDERTLVVRLRDRDADPDSDWTWLDGALLSGDVAFFTGMLERMGPVGTQSWPALGATNNGSVTDEIAVGEPGGRFSSFGDLDVTSDGLVAVGVLDQQRGPAIATARFGGALQVIASGANSTYGGVSIGQGDDVSYFLTTATGLRLVASSGDVVDQTDPDSGLGPEPPISMGPGTAIAYTHSYAHPTMPGRAGLQIRRWNPSTGTSSILADTVAGDFGLHANRVKVSLLDQTGLAGDGNGNGWGGCVAFLGTGAEGRDAIFIADEDGIATIVQEGDEIAGRIAGSLDMGPMAIHATGQIAFWATLGDREAIIRADPATGPGGGGGDDAGGDDAGDGDPGDSGDSGDPGDRGGDGGSEGGCASIGGGASAAWSLVVVAALLSIGQRSAARRRTAIPVRVRIDRARPGPARRWSLPGRRRRPATPGPARWRCCGCACGGSTGPWAGARRRGPGRR